MTQIHPLNSKWDHASDPKCTEGYDWVVADAALAIASAASGIGVATKIGDRQTAGEVALGGIVLGGVFGVTAAIGYDEVDDCHAAYEQWRVANAVTNRAKLTSPACGDQSGECKESK